MKFRFHPSVAASTTLLAALLLIRATPVSAQNNAQSNQSQSGNGSTGGAPTPVNGVNSNGIGNGASGLGQGGSQNQGNGSNSHGNGGNDDGDQRKAQADAKNLVKGSNVTGADQRLASSNATQANTASWHQETSQKLMQVAESFSREGDSAHSKVVITQTLQHLDSAATLAHGNGDAPGEASARAMAGFIQERYHGDIASAIASYQAALKATPNDKAIQEQLSRLQRTDAVLRARIHAKH